MDDLDYWKECISIAAEECDLTLTVEQLEYLADSASTATPMFPSGSTVKYCATTAELRRSNNKERK